MKVHFTLILASALLPLACGQATDAVNSAKGAVAISSQDQAANELYLDDAIDSLADDSSNSGRSDGSEIKDDMKAERIKQMADILIKRLDADVSGSLSLEEYLVGSSKHAEKRGLDEAKLAAIKTKMTEEFNKAAGDDKLLSAAEAEVLLKAAAPRIGQHRKGKPEGQTERVKKISEDMLKEFDKDGDGKLSETELEAFRAEKCSEMEKFRGKASKGRGGKPSDSETGTGAGSEPSDNTGSV